MRSKYNFRKLTSTKKADIEVYEEAFKFIFANQDLKNIAVSGPYGSGKSSIIETYHARNKDKKIIYISLAYFEKIDVKKEGLDTEKEELDTRESIMEGKILNQLIHQISSEKIPQTNFRIKKTNKSWSPILTSTLFLLFIISILHINFFEEWSNYVRLFGDSRLKNILTLATTQISIIISGLICLTLLGMFFYNIIKAQKNYNLLRKIKISEYEIEIFEENEGSYFDKYLNEVLYLFENLDADAIVFEDMDRYDMTRIFERLREINTLANLQLSKKKKKTLRFFYLLRDDIFESKDRVKFFDYILPIVPIIDSSNSYDQFISQFEREEKKYNFNRRFLQGLSRYIDDMRILKNIYNEFIIYYNKLNITELDVNKMLAMITYKNLFPRDFSDLQLNRGLVFNLFNKKQDFIKIEKKAIKENIDKKEEEIEFTKNEHLESIEELDLVFQDRKYKDYYNKLTPEAKEIYEKRKQSIENKLENKIDGLEIELLEMNNKLIEINNKLLKEIITRENIDRIFKTTYVNELGEEIKFKEVRASEYFDLLKYLIRNGHIDETYEDYMTHFYGYSISREDKIFLRSITDQRAKDYDYKLEKPELILEKLDLVDFDELEILNFDLLNYLLKSNSYEHFIERMIEQLKNTRNFEFAISYFENNKETSKYVEKINEYWRDFVSEVLKNEKMTARQIRKYSILTLTDSDEKTIEGINIDNCLTKYISKSSDYLAIDNPNIENFINKFILLGVSFKNIDVKKSNRELFEKVYQNSLYVLNYENLSLMLKEFYQYAYIKDIKHRNYSLIISLEDSPLINYVNEEIENYMDIMLSNCSEHIYDNEEAALKIINNEMIAHSYKHQYISYLKTKIKKVTAVIDKSLWRKILENKLVKYSEENIISYYNEIKLIDEFLSSFINSSGKTLKFSSSEEIENEELDEFFKSTITCDQISNKKYREILKKSELEYIEFNINEIPIEKVNILIDLSIIPMTVENLLFMREEYEENLYYFIKKNIEQYVKIITNRIFDINELLEIISWNIEDNLKIELIDQTNEPISVLEKNYSIFLKNHILENNYQIEDINKLINQYDQEEAKMQEVILEFVIRQIDEVIDEVDTMSQLLLKDILYTEELNDKIKFEVFLNSFQIWNELELKKILSLLGYKKFCEIFESKKRPRFKINEANEELLMKFQACGLIKEYRESFGKDFFTIRRFSKSKKIKI